MSNHEAEAFVARLRAISEEAAEAENDAVGRGRSCPDLNEIPLSAARHHLRVEHLAKGVQSLTAKEVGQVWKRYHTEGET